MNTPYTKAGRYCNDNARIDGKVVIVTGANTGLGKATTLDLAKRGGKIYMACRSRERGLAALNEIKDLSGNNNLHFLTLDLGSLDSVREFSKKFHELESRLDILINNAGLVSPLNRTKDNFEMNMGVNHLGHFLLTNLLLDLLKTAAPSRIVVVSSYLYNRGEINRKDFNYEKEFPGYLKAYSTSKLANILFMKKLSKMLEGTSVTVNAVCPGWVDTEASRYMNFFIRAIVVPFQKIFYETPEVGALTQIMVAVEPALEKVTGKYFTSSKETELTGKVHDDETAEWLWKKSLQLTGIEDETTKF